MTVELEVRQVTKRFGTFAAVDDVTLQVRQGEFLSILGPSGCGKTTTLRMLAGLVQPTQGRIFIRGQDVTELPPYKRHIGMVFQDYALFPHMTVSANVAFGLEMQRRQRDEIARRVEEALRLVRLGDLGQRRPLQLSGGQQQRVALARAIAPNPQVLLLDEPLSNLDLKLRQELRVELKQIQKKVGITTIFVTHDQGEALSLSDRVVVMRSGRIEQMGAPMELYEQPLNRFVASFLGEANFFSGRVERMGTAALVRAEEGVTLAVPGLERPVGSTVTVAVRPEKIRFAAVGGAVVGDGTLARDERAPNTVQGTIEAYTYLGSTTRYYVRSGQNRILVDTPQLSSAPVQEGETVTLCWDQTNCVHLQEDSQ